MNNRKIDLPNYQKFQNNNPLLNQLKPYPLKGLLVIDFSRVLVGPYCAKMLADAGADQVISYLLKKINL